MDGTRDNLVSELRNAADYDFDSDGTLLTRAADRIELLERELARMGEARERLRQRMARTIRKLEAELEGIRAAYRA